MLIKNSHNDFLYLVNPFLKLIKLILLFFGFRLALLLKSLVLLLLDLNDISKQGLVILKHRVIPWQVLFNLFYFNFGFSIYESLVLVDFFDHGRILKSLDKHKQIVIFAHGSLLDRPYYVFLCVLLDVVPVCVLQ